MCDASINGSSASTTKGCSSIAKGIGSVTNVIINDDGAAFNLANDVHHFGIVIAFTTLVNDGEAGVEVTGHITATTGASGIRGGNDKLRILARDSFQNVDEDEMAGQEIQRHVAREKALNLLHVNVHCDHMIHPHRRQHIRHHTRRDRLTHLGLPILTCVAVIRDHSCHMVHRSSLRRIDG